MAYFCVHALDRPDTATLRQELRPAHRLRLREHDHPVTVHIGGPLLGDDGQMIGTMLVIEADDRSAVERYLAGDPYVVGGLFAAMTVTGFQWGLGLPEAHRG